MLAVASPAAEPPARLLLASLAGFDSPLAAALVAREEAIPGDVGGFSEEGRGEARRGEARRLLPGGTLLVHVWMRTEAMDGWVDGWMQGVGAVLVLLRVNPSSFV